MKPFGPQRISKTRFNFLLENETNNHNNINNINRNHSSLYTRGSLWTWMTPQPTALCLPPQQRQATPQRWHALRGA